MENVRRLFGISSVVILTGVVATAAACSDPPGADPGGDLAEAGPGRREAGPPNNPDVTEAPQEQTVGKLCSANADCEVPNSVGDNVCSIGFFTIGDLYANPVCVSPCVRGAGSTVGDILCDGDENGAPGVCNASTPGGTGVCLPACAFDSKQLGKPSCNGDSNKCTPQFFLTANDGAMSALGICLSACKADADCKGSPGQKCQVEIGLCVNPDKHVAYAKAPGALCNAAASADECNCAAVGGTGANKDRGYCTTSCVTGTNGDAACNTAVAGWKCSAGLPTTLDSKPAFTGQPDGILGLCVKPCTIDTDCDQLATTIGGGVAVKCEDAAGFKVCVPQK